MEAVAGQAPGRLLRGNDVAVATLIVGVLAIMIFPLPAVLLDFLLALNILCALCIIMVSIYITEPLQFSVFPSLLLVITLFRLSLNVASTRLILADGYAGSIIASFGSFVVRGNYVVGFVMFLILVVINFVVITKGSNRISEVAARFTLDAMPGKQMAIDADLNAGLIDDEEARERRDKIAREADFYGAMDGAAKFVRGDVVAGIIITVVNIVGGLVIGVAQRGMGVADAAATYTMLTVGDGLVTQIPGLVISTAAGIVVTRAASGRSLGEELGREIFQQKQPILIASCVLGILGLLPGLPFLPFASLALLAGGFAATLKPVPLETERTAEGRRLAAKGAGKDAAAKPSPDEEVARYLHVDPLELTIGYGLISLVAGQGEGELPSKITTARKQAAMELGLVVPPIRIRDSAFLGAHDYAIHVHGVEVARGALKPGYVLAMNGGEAKDEVRGIDTVEPAFGLPARWIGRRDRERAEMLGYTVVDGPAVLATHLMEVLKAHAHEILSRQMVRRLVDRVAENHPAVVEELIPHLLSLGDVHKVLRNLLRERVPIRDLPLILEILADHAGETKDAEAMTEHVRRGLAKVLTREVRGEGNTVKAILLDPAVEEGLHDGFRRAKTEGAAALPPEFLAKIAESAAKEAERVMARGRKPIVITAPSLRPQVKRILETRAPDLPVLSYLEITPDVTIESEGIVRVEHEG